ncbi:class I SAM-dependent methyltransferase [Rhodopseudomonas sp. HC1]|uniref:class I SAM-dependent methyltransferase n=1 Tax=Rhodopseudomonas infernalis TaxID=2897386 RepID=UPI001EE99A56|nr:class I SAM-dependent methyltransferase [Rhodopseudomonas infernalis]MCG6203141.1 class I SAM-dependent methyltransferase [Rhodopseudomonas infernalis]
MDISPCKTTQLPLHTVSPCDPMREAGKEKEYFAIGLGALDLCKRALRGTIPLNIVDFQCGYGRVTRWFRREWPTATITAVEIDQGALDFVQSTFQAVPVAADAQLTFKLEPGANLIFSGSLLTHLDEWQWDRFLRIAIDALAPDGILVFTIHGRIAALLAEQRHPVYGNAIDTKKLYDAYKTSGFAFLPYAKEYPTFGLSLSSPEWIMRKLQAIPEVSIIAFEEGGWGQDVVAVRRHPWPMVLPDFAPHTNGI